MAVSMPHGASAPTPTRTRSMTFLDYALPANAGCPAHTGSVVWFKDSSGAMRELPWHRAASYRVIQQDTLQSNKIATSGTAAFSSTQESMLRYLNSACNVDDGCSFRDRLALGAGMLDQYPNLTTQEQFVWLAQDRRLRETCLPRLVGIREQVQNVIRSPELQAPESRARLPALLNNDTALAWLILGFKDQIAHICGVQQGLLAILPRETAIDLAERCGLQAPPATMPPRLPQQEAQPSSATIRHPLAPLATNSNTEMKAAIDLKRKRVQPTSRVITEVINLCESDEETEEQELQGQVDALNAKIAAIRSRTAQGDELMPSKKPRTKTRPAQKDFRAPEVANRPGIQNGTVPSPLSASSKTGFQPPALETVVARRITIYVQLQGRNSLKLNISTDTHFAKVIATARKHWAIPEAEDVYLKLAGRKVDPSERIRRTTLQQDGYIDLHVVSASTTPLPPMKQAYIQPTVSGPDQYRPQHQQFPLTGPKWVTDHSVADIRSSSTPPAEIAPPPPKPVITPSLCPEQQAVVDLILAGKNVFYTGSAGCGKSTVLKSFVPKLRDKGKTVRIIAPTGKAALDVNGSTTWTFAGCAPLHMKRPLKDLKKAAHGKFVNKRFRETDVLVIDEVSMLENHLFERLNAIMKEARGSDRAFGGVQLIVTGDFTQLPPVKPFQYCMTCGKEQPQRMGPSGQTLYRCPQHGDQSDSDKWAFRSAAWEECQFHHVNLTTIHRQSDEVFIKILQKLRMGNALTNQDRGILLEHPCDVENAVKLFPTRDQVKRINQTEFERLPSAKQGYTCLDYFSWNQEKHPHLESKGKRSPFDGSLEALREHRLENSVELKKDMLVVLLVNLEHGSGLVNGSQGRIVDFEPYDPAKLPKARRDGGDGPSNNRSFSSKPSSQSRKRRDGSVEPEASMIQGELRGEYAAMREGQIRWFINHPRNKAKMWPVVEFDNGLKRTIYADCQINELGDEAPYTLMARTQIPLVAAWAMTIHKSQGMTLNRVVVDLGKSFEEGQEYVALSRARSLDGLKVVALGDGVGKGGNAQVKEFLWQKFKLR